VIGPAVQLQGRRLFDHASRKRLSLTRSVTPPSGYLLVDFQVEN
jgi:hypothetical protein